MALWRLKIETMLRMQSKTLTARPLMVAASRLSSRMLTLEVIVTGEVAEDSIETRAEGSIHPMIKFCSNFTLSTKATLK